MANNENVEIFQILIATFTGERTAYNSIIDAFVTFLLKPENNQLIDETLLSALQSAGCDTKIIKFFLTRLECVADAELISSLQGLIDQKLFIFGTKDQIQEFIQKHPVQVPVVPIDEKVQEIVQSAIEKEEFICDSEHVIELRAWQSVARLENLVEQLKAQLDDARSVIALLSETLTQERNTRAKQEVILASIKGIVHQN